MVILRCKKESEIKNMADNEKTNIQKPKYLKSRNNRVRVILDFDDVITACLRAVIKAYNEQYGTSFRPGDFTTWNLIETLGCTLEDLLKIFRTPGFFENLEPNRGAIGAIRELIKSTKYDLYIVTATSDDDGSEYVEKIKWLKTYIKEFNIKRLISCQDKEIIRADVIIDDKVENLDKCAPFMHCILMDSPTNKDCDKYIRLDRMKNLPALLNQMFYNDGDGIRTFEKEIAPKILEEQRATNDVDQKKAAKRKPSAPLRRKKL